MFRLDFAVAIQDYDERSSISVSIFIGKGEVNNGTIEREIALFDDGIRRGGQAIKCGIAHTRSYVKINARFVAGSGVVGPQHRI